MRQRIHITRWVSLGLLCVVGPLAGNCEAASREYMQLMADLRMLQEQSQQLQVTINALTEALKLVTGRMDDQAAVARKAFADQKLLIDMLTSDVRVIREKQDETNVRVSSLSQEFEALRTDVTTLTTLAPQTAAPIYPTDNAQATPSVDPSALPPPPSAPPPAPAVTGLSPQRLYDQAYADYGAGQWALAIRGFETYLATFPRTEQADDAQYMIGETFVWDGKPEQAVAAYDKVIANYPSGDQVQMAYYKRGLTLQNLGQLDRARESWQTLVDKFPDSDASRLAKQKLSILARPEPK